MSILITIIGFGIMIFLHELGHFIAAKRFGVLVHEFSIGMGPKLFSRKSGETQYSVRLFPIGGYVKLEGETQTEEEQDANNPRSFINLTPIKRIIILAAGAFMNVLLGFIIFTIINMNTGVTPSKVYSVPEEFSQSSSYFQPGDELVKLDNTRVHTFNDVALFMSRCNKDEISVTLRRDGKVIVYDNFKPLETKYGRMLGISFGRQEASILKSAEFAVYDTVYITKAVFFAIGDLFTGKAPVSSLSGPVEIVSVVGDVASVKDEYTYLNILMLFAMITVNLGVFNLLPFPALDGGSIIFALYELITRKKVKNEIIGYATTIGFVLLMVLAVFVTAGDVIDLVKK